MLKTASIFQDNMVIQREKPVRIWGECDFEGDITVSIQGQTASSAVASGQWSVTLPCLRASKNERMIISGNGETLCFESVAVGEVWLAAGQSNMEFYLRYDRERKTAVENPSVRFFDVPKTAYAGELEDFDYSDFGFWRSCTEPNLDYYSAAAYYFALQLQEHLGVPVGIIGCTWGGTPACAWQDPRYLENNEGKVWLEDYEKVLEDTDLETYEKLFAANPDNYKGKPFENAFLERMMYGMTVEELMAYLQENVAAGNTSMIPVEGPKSEKRPGGLYENMVETIAPYTVRGVIWYQGENDDQHPEVYGVVFQSLIRCWRDRWDEELPFLFVQLAPFHYWVEEGRYIFPLLREQQQWVRDHTSNCWMASIMDHGLEHDIHPKCKRPVGERLALLALGHVYGEVIACDPPELDCAELEEGRITLHFANAESGLVVHGDSVNAIELLEDNEPVGHYTVDLDSNCMILRSERISPERNLQVHFARQDYCEVNLYNREGLAALPFSWPQ